MRLRKTAFGDIPKARSESKSALWYRVLQLEARMAFLENQLGVKASSDRANGHHDQIRADK